MRIFLLTTFLFILTCPTLEGQDSSTKAQEKIEDQSGLYFYWGWNNDWFTKSDIRFYGPGYRFTLQDVVAKDRQSDFSFETYFNPGYATIPQYNFRLGYFWKEWDFSFGIDHMKYVLQNDTRATISGRITGSNSQYDGFYYQEEIQLAKDFITFEHTDGLNYINLELRRNFPMFTKGFVSASTLTGLGAGIMFPKTNTTLFGSDNYDAFHFSGTGFAGLGGLRLRFWKHLFIQSELKGGYINMPTIRTSINELAGADQSFFFLQLNAVAGARFELKRRTIRFQ